MDDALQATPHPVVPMKTIGLLGGMSPEATREYYRLINQGVRDRLDGHNGAELLIASVNFQNIERFIRGEQWQEAGAYLAQKARSLEAGGADYLFLATNTMHRVRERIRDAITIPFIDIFEVTAQAISEQRLTRVGILSTHPVMTDPFFRTDFEARGIAVLSPPDHEKSEIDRIIFEELCRHQFTAHAKACYLRAIENLTASGAQGVILGCTEIKLLINQADVPDTPLFDTTTLHCARAVELCLSAGR